MMKGKANRQIGGGFLSALMTAALILQPFGSMATLAVETQQPEIESEHASVAITSDPEAYLLIWPEDGVFILGDDGAETAVTDVSGIEAKVYFEEGGEQFEDVEITADGKQLLKGVTVGERGLGLPDTLPREMTKPSQIKAYTLLVKLTLAEKTGYCTKVYEVKLNNKTWGGGLCAAGERKVVFQKTPQIVFDLASQDYSGGMTYTAALMDDAGQYLRKIKTASGAEVKKYLTHVREDLTGSKSGKYQLLLHTGQDSVFQNDLATLTGYYGLKEGRDFALHTIDVSGENGMEDVLLSDSDLGLIPDCHGTVVPLDGKKSYYRADYDATENCFHMTFHYEPGIYAEEHKEYASKKTVADLSFTFDDGYRWIKPAQADVAGELAGAMFSEPADAAVTDKGESFDVKLFNADSTAILPNEIRFDVKPELFPSGWAKVTVNGIQSFQTQLVKNGISLWAPSVVLEKQVVLSGQAAPNTNVELMEAGVANDKKIGETRTNVAGFYKLNVDLADMEDGESRTFYATVPEEGKKLRSDSREVSYLKNETVATTLEIMNGPQTPYYAAKKKIELQKTPISVFSYDPSRTTTFRMEAENTQKVESFTVTDEVIEVPLSYDEEQDLWFGQDEGHAFRNKIKIVLKTKDGKEYVVEETEIRWIIDPSGMIYEATEKNPVEGARVQVYLVDEDGKETAWDADPYLQENPLSSNAAGAYAWDVPAGKWKVKATKDGYQNAESAILTVPPIQTQIDLELKSKSAPKVIGAELDEQRLHVYFDNYVTLYSAGKNIELYAGEEQIAMSASDESASHETAVRKGVKIVKDVEFTFEEPLTAVQKEGCTLKIAADTVAAYDSSVPMVEETVIEGLKAEGIISDIGMTDILMAKNGSYYTYEVEILPAEAAAGRQLVVTSENEAVVQIINYPVADENGKAVIALTGVGVGETAVRIAVKDSAYEKTVRTVTAVSDAFMEKLCQINELESVPKPVAKEDIPNLENPADKEKPVISDNTVSDNDADKNKDQDTAKDKDTGSHTATEIADKKDETVAAKKLTLSGISKKIAAGKKITLTAKIEPANATDKAIVWKSSNTKYATVDAGGVVKTYKKAAGKKVTITASLKNNSKIKASYKITIMKDAVKSIKLSAKKSVKAGKSVTVKATVRATGKKVNKTLVWTSSNTKYATVTKKGVVKTKKAGKGKTVTITAKATDGSGKKATVKIKIK